MSDSTKTQDARKHGVPIITEQQLKEMLEDLIGRGATLTLGGHAYHCKIVERLNDECVHCHDNFLIVSAFAKGQEKYVKTCKCHLEINYGN